MEEWIHDDFTDERTSVRHPLLLTVDSRSPSNESNSGFV